MLQVFPFKARTGSYGSGQASFLWLLSCRTIGDIPRTEGLTPESVSRRQQKEPLDLTFPCGGALVGDLGGPADLQFSVSFGLVPQAGKTVALRSAKDPGNSELDHFEQIAYACQDESVGGSRLSYGCSRRIEPS